MVDNLFKQFKVSFAGLSFKLICVRTANSRYLRFDVHFLAFTNV